MGSGHRRLARCRNRANARRLRDHRSPAILEYAAKAASDARLDTVTTRELDGEHLDVEEASFDAVISRVGLIYFPDQQAALAGMRRALRPGGRICAVVYSTAERNGFFAIPVGIIRRRAQLPPPTPGQPGPFRLGGTDVARDLLSAAGFHDIEVETVPSPLRMASAADCVAFERDSFGALHQMLAGLPAPDRDETWAEIGRALAEFEGPDGFVGPCEMLVISATR